MKPTKEEFVRRWRPQCVLLGMDALEILRQGREVREHKAEMLLKLPSQISEMLGRMYDELNPPPAPANGPPAQQPQARAKA